jgi:molecular chaperone DnaJ
LHAPQNGVGDFGYLPASTTGTTILIGHARGLEEIANGVEKKVKVKRKVQAPGVTYKHCSACGGSGQVTKITNTILGRMQTATACSNCGGSGQMIDSKPREADASGMIVKEETVSIKIPPGVESGMQLKVNGKGNEAPGNGISGDLLVAIESKEHPTLKREGDNLHYDLYISDVGKGIQVKSRYNQYTGNNGCQ